MIRFIDLGDQILEGEKMFAWYNTVTDTFEEYSGNQRWSSWEEFKEDFAFHFPTIPAIIDEMSSSDKLDRLERYKGLFKWEGVMFLKENP